jgi:NADH-quinone oxidoreductase subunit N
MIAEQIKAYFIPEALHALVPVSILAIGFLALMLASALDLSRSAQGTLTVATLVGALVAFGRLLTEGFAPGPLFDGAWIADRASTMWGLVFVSAALVAWLFSLGHYREERPFLGEHDLLFLCAPAGMAMMAAAGNWLAFFVGLELLSIPLYALCAFRRERARSVEAGLKYFLLGAFSTAVFLFGVALVYSATGNLSVVDPPREALASPLALAGLGLITSSLLFKLGAFPFQLWVPDVYEGAPTPVTGLMAAGTKAAAFAFLVRVSELLPHSSATGLGILALVTLLLGNLGALAQSDVKRMLAYSGVAHAGTLLLAVVARLGGHPDPNGAVAAGLYYAAAYAFSAGGAFGLVALLERQGEHFTRITSLNGLFRRRPAAAAGLSLCLLSLGGLPLTGGFMGKWLVFSLTIQAHMLALTVVAVLLSVVALGYYLRVIVAMFMRPEPAELVRDEVAGRSGLLPAAVAASLCCAMVLVTGLAPGWLLSVLP